MALKPLPKGIGIANSFLSGTLKSVLYVPHCPFNHIFLSNIAYALHCYIIFSDKTVILALIPRALLPQHTYCLHLRLASLQILQYLSTIVWVIQVSLNFRKWSRIFPLYPPLIGSFQLGKHARVSFPKSSNNWVTSLFALFTVMFGALVILLS